MSAGNTLTNSNDFYTVYTRI